MGQMDLRGSAFLFEDGVWRVYCVSTGGAAFSQFLAQTVADTAGKASLYRGCRILA